MCPWVFHRQGGPIKTFRGSWARACAEAGLEGKIPHDFRRTVVRNLVRAGVSEHVDQQMTGHLTRAIFDTYDIVSTGDLKAAAIKLSERINTQTTAKTTATDHRAGSGAAISH